MAKNTQPETVITNWIGEPHDHTAVVVETPVVEDAPVEDAPVEDAPSE
jgi:hypothetical protein